MQSADITDAAIFSMSSPPHTPRRSTVSATQTQPQARIRASNSQCTHMTVTRLFTKEFRCSICLRVAPLGWLYRCTQDRELILYDDMERGFQDKLDKICDLFELPNPPPPRHPVARLDSLSLFSEITEEQLKTYSKEQLNLLLKQRVQVLKTASAPDSAMYKNPFSSESYYTIPLNSSQENSHEFFTTPATPGKFPDRPYFPLKGGECQYKCCHFCRQNMHERAYLSLNGIADGNIPATAILGFGFHLSKKRPVAVVKHVKNLGLRPVPAPRAISDTTTALENAYKKIPPPPNKLSKPLNRRNTTQGLGIFSTTVSPSSIIPDPTDLPESSNIATHSHYAEHDFTRVPIPTHLPYNPTTTNESQDSPLDNMQDLLSLRHAHTNPAVLSFPNASEAWETTSTVCGAGSVDAKLTMGLEYGVSAGENEKEALLELDMKEKDEQTATVHAQVVQSEMDITDVVAQF